MIMKMMIVTTFNEASQYSACGVSEAARVQVV